jgi:hypothetical protein
MRRGREGDGGDREREGGVSSCLRAFCVQCPPPTLLSEGSLDTVRLPKDSLAQPHMDLLCKVPVLFSIFMLLPLPPTVDHTLASSQTRTASNG